MSLKKVVLEVVDRMRAEASEAQDANELMGVLLTGLAELKGAANATPDDPPPQDRQWPPAVPPALSEAAVRERQRLQEQKRAMQAQEADSFVMTPCVGGPADGCNAPRHASMPVGARMAQAGAVYELKEVGGETELHFVAPVKRVD